jgi:hypothetical protein
LRNETALPGWKSPIYFRVTDGTKRTLTLGRQVVLFYPQTF